MPDVKQQLVRTFLTDASLAYRNRNYIYSMVAPILNVPSPRTKITKYNKGSWFRDEAIVRAPGTETPVSKLSTTSVNLSTRQIAAAYDITDEDIQNSGIEGGAPTQDLKLEAVEAASDKLDLRNEINLATIVRAANFSGVGAGGEDAAGLWVPAGSTNTAWLDVVNGINTIVGNTGIKPNRLAVDRRTFEGMRRCDELRDAVKYSGGYLNEQVMAQAFGLDMVIVSDAIYSTAEETAAQTDFTALNIWETNANKGFALLYYVPPAITIRSLSTFAHVRAPVMNSSLNRAIFETRDDLKHLWHYEAMEECESVVLSTDLAYHWNDTAAT